jgi:V8-like Glu-specific endopeptidase
MTNGNQLTPVEQLAFTTVRIETDLNNGEIGTGTGFFYKAKERDNGLCVPVIVTNKHVIKDSNKGRFRLTLLNAQDLPDIGNHTTIELDAFEGRWVHHPDSNIDLCAMPIASLLGLADEQNSKFFFIPFDKSLLPVDKDYDSMFGMDDITMIGYPNGIWDEANNFPVFRKGITATNPKYDWNNKKEFLIDCACFPGSSGSPVILINMGGYFTGSGLSLGSRLKLLGILYAGPQHTATGEIEIVDVPVAQKPVLISRIPNNLGIVIKSELLKDFDDVFD